MSHSKNDLHQNSGILVIKLFLVDTFSKENGTPCVVLVYRQEVINHV